MIIEHRKTAMTAEKAGEVARTLNADTEDEWFYRVVDIAGRCYIATEDEDGEFVGWL